MRIAGGTTGILDQKIDKEKTRVLEKFVLNVGFFTPVLVNYFANLINSEIGERIGLKIDSKPDKKPDSKPDSKLDSKSDSKPDSKPDSKIDQKIDPKNVQTQEFLENFDISCNLHIRKNTKLTCQYSGASFFPIGCQSTCSVSVNNQQTPLKSTITFYGNKKTDEIKSVMIKTGSKKTKILVSKSGFSIKHRAESSNKYTLIFTSQFLKNIDETNGFGAIGAIEQVGREIFRMVSPVLYFYYALTGVDNQLNEGSTNANFFGQNGGFYENAVFSDVLQKVVFYDEYFHENFDVENPISCQKLVKSLKIKNAPGILDLQ